MTRILVVIGIIGLIALIAGLIMGNSAVAWAGAVALVIGIVIPLLRFFMGGRAPDNKFPWE